MYKVELYLIVSHYMWISMISEAKRNNILVWMNFFSYISPFICFLFLLTYVHCCYSRQIFWLLFIQKKNTISFLSMKYCYSLFFIFLFFCWIRQTLWIDNDDRTFFCLEKCSVYSIRKSLPLFIFLFKFFCSFFLLLLYVCVCVCVWSFLREKNLNWKNKIMWGILA